VELGVDVAVAVDPVVVDADLLELEHAAARNDRPTNETAKIGTRRPNGLVERCGIVGVVTGRHYIDKSTPVIRS